MPILVVEAATFGGNIMPEGWLVRAPTAWAHVPHASSSHRATFGAPQEGEVAELEAAGVDVRLGLAQQPDDVQAEWLAEANALVMFSHTHIDAEFLDTCLNLQIVLTPSVGFDNIDAVECARRGIYVTNGAGSITETTADLTLCCLLGACRRLGANHMAVVAGPEASARTWFVGAGGLGDDPGEYFGGPNKVLGIVGFGRIGQALAQKCRAAFNMDIIFHDISHVSSHVAGARQVPFDELLATADFVSINSLLDDSSRHLIGKVELAKMKKGSYLINVARGPLVDEDALVEALESGHLAGAGLDVYEYEPPEAKPATDDEPGTIGPGKALREAPNVFLQPHSGSATTRARQEMQYLCMRNIKAALVEGRGPLTPVNMPLNAKL
jgi:glyoxylate reductase